MHGRVASSLLLTDLKCELVDTRVGNFLNLLYFQLLSVTVSKFFITSKNKVKIQVLYGMPKVPIPSLSVFVLW